MQTRTIFALGSATLLALAATVAVARPGEPAAKPPAATSAVHPAGHDKTHASEGKSSSFTLLQVMQHLAASQQQIQTGLLMNNRLMIERGASAIADHPMPKGGIKPYIKKNHAALSSTIKAMDEQVHSSAVSLAAQAGTASMVELQALNDRMVVGCISCHNVFRD